jgi:hypothetical protein
MEVKLIIVLGTMVIPQVESVFRKLQERTDKVTLLDISDNNNLSLILKGDGVTLQGLDIKDFSVAWVQGKFIYRYFGDTVEWTQDYLSGKMQRNSHDNITSILPCEVINSIEVRSICSNKLNQLKLASAVGLKVPRTLVSNSNAEIYDFLGDGEGIVKCIGDPHIPNVTESCVLQESVFTSIVDKCYLSENLEHKEPFPVFIQEFVRKKFEYRCVYVDGQMFSFRINPNEHELFEVDYRRGGYHIEYVPCEIPIFLQLKIISLARNIGLFSGCFDFIEDLSGNYVFLEVNTEGIWGYHDDIVGGKISDAFANAIIKKSLRSSSVKNGDNVN